MFNLDVLFSISNIILFMAIFTRLSGLFMSAPIFSTYPIPMQVKIWLAALRTLLTFKGSIFIILSYFLTKYQIQIENWIVDKLTTKKKLEVYYSNDTKIIIEKEKKIYIVAKYVKEDNIYVKKYSSEKFTSIQDARKKADELISIEKKYNSSACVDNNLIKKVSQ